MNTTGLDLELGRIPPQAIELEEAVLGAILLEKDAVTEILDILTPESFYKEEHQKIFKTVIELFTNSKGIDILTVSEQLRRKKELDEIGGPLYVTGLTSRVASASHIIDHAKIIQEKYLKRELIRISTEINRISFDDESDIKDVLIYSQSELFNLILNKQKRSRHIAEIGVERLKELEEISKLDKEFTGVPSGFTKLDRITSGWQNSDLIIIAGRPSMGKTSTVLEFAINAAEFNFYVDLYSLEMKDKQLYDKSISRKTGIENSFLRTNKMNDVHWQLIEKGHGKLEKIPLYIDDTPSLDVVEFRAKARRNKIKFDTKLIIIDYLQLMRSTEAYKRGGREREVADISEQLKATAKELDVPIIALSQMSRAIDSRTGNKKPRLSDLRESGAIEQNADLVIFIHRPEVYGMLEDDEGKSTKNLIELIIAKHRNGVIGDLSIWKNDIWTEFYEYDTFNMPEINHYYEKDNIQLTNNLNDDGPF